MSKQGGKNKGRACEDQWYLSFDCATKSFAFALLRIREHPDVKARGDAIVKTLLSGDLPKSREMMRRLDEESRNCFALAGGGAADLAPGRNDKTIPTVERIRLVKEYLHTKVAQAMKGAEGCPPPDSPRLNVAVEFQMGPNSKSRTVAITLIAHFSRANVFLVGPAYKNKLWYPSRPDIRHCFFVQKYKSLYTANKNHAKALYFEHIAKIFGHLDGKVLKSVPDRFRKDFSDSVLQILGFLAYGDIGAASSKF
jgi:hypothetical protein